MRKLSLSGYLAVGLSLLAAGSALPNAAAATPLAPDALLWYQDSQGSGQIQIEQRHAKRSRGIVGVTSAAAACGQ